MVYKNSDIKQKKQISDIKADYVISFNYILTEKMYGISENKVHHIHGAIRENLSEGENNMVLGVNGKENQNMDFIYFVKYFQRIQKQCGTRYKGFVNQKNQDMFMEFSGIKKPYCLHIYGHSLDVADEDILKYVIGDFDQDRFHLKPKKVIIYYYNQVDFERKVINLIKLYGRNVVEQYMENDTIHFELITEDNV